MIKQTAWILLALGLTACSSVERSTQALESGISETLFEDKPAQWSDSYAGNAEVQAFIDKMVKDHNFERKRLDVAFSHIKLRPKVIERSDNQPEVLIPYFEYKTRFVNLDRARMGRAFATRNQDWLRKAEQDFGVEASIIVALIGVETYYGRITGSRDVFTSLTTLAFDYPRRKAYFQSELEAYLLLARENNWNIGATKGSYSGAMGMAQFMPSNYRTLAIDYDKDGLIDLWGSDADAIGSVANYLKHHGWQKGQPWFVTAQVADPDRVKEEINRGRRPSKDFEEWSLLGVVPNQSSVSQKTYAQKAGLIALRTGPDDMSYWLAFENFFTIMDYNPSRRYAMAVLELTESIERYESD